MRFVKIIAAAAATAGMLAAGPAVAHAKLLKSTPSAHAGIAAPRMVSVSFDDPLVPAFSKLLLVMPMSGHNMALPLSTRFVDHGKTMVGTPNTALKKGSYALNWTAATPDGHRTTGSVPFQVR